MGAVLIAAAEALFSSSPGMVANPTVNSAVILAAISAKIAGELANAPEALFPTVTASITIATLLTGGVFIALGWFRLGNLIRYIPYPVIGGFLAGTGGLVVSGALKTMSGIPFRLANYGKFTQAGVLLHWIPGVIFGVLLLLLIRRFKHYLISPMMILGTVLAFYLILWLGGISIEQATQEGLLFQPFPPGAMWRPPPLAELASVDWGLIARQAGEIATLILISSITLLLYASGVEVATAREVDLNQELRACGVGNLGAALSASPPGYTIITMSVLSNRLGANSRLVGLLLAGICAGVMFFGAPLISLFPKPVLGGVLTFLGLTFLVEWLYDGWRKLSHADYAIVVIIFLVMSASGLLPGLGFGIALAAGLFLVQYSRVPVVRHIFSGRNYHSRVERSHPHAELLRQEGQALIILELQGFVFFGTANGLYVQLKGLLESAQSTPPKVVMLDFRRVSGIDASASLSLLRLKRSLNRHRVLLAFTHLRPEIERRLQRDLLVPGDQQTWRVFPDLDHGMEWFEEQVLRSEAGMQVMVQAQPGVVQAGQGLGGLALLFATLGREMEDSIESPDQALLRLLGYLERVSLDIGETIIRQGERHQCLYFLDSGELTVEYRTEEDQVMRLATSGPGTIVGELSLFLERPATATVKAAQPSVVYCLSSDNLRRLEREDLLAATVLYRFLLKRVGQRLLSALETVEALSD
jgi:SulP family sulfate permease